MDQVEKPKIWTKTKQLFQPSLQDQNIHIVYDSTDSEISKALELESEMNPVIERVEKRVGITKQEALADPTKKKELSQALKKDQGWGACFKDICEFFAPNLDPNVAINEIDRPYWNNLQFGFVSDEYKTANYHVNSKISHSLLTQLKETTKGKFGVLKLQSVSVAGNIITADNRLVLGHRGGNSFYDVIMSVPAGSVEPHLKPGERGALFGSYDKELAEELALGPGDHDSELIARVEEKHLSAQGTQYYVFRTKVNMELDELLEHWKTAVDREEHRHLVFYDAKDPEILLSTIKYTSFDPSKADERMNQTSFANRGKILPQCSGPILAYLTAEHGFDWAASAETYLDGHFDLTSCKEVIAKNE
tara:strand:+ start:1973 stop:3061 length:1089 start_codon:yes stop_codon:yes gene_type:complete